MTPTLSCAPAHQPQTPPKAALCQQHQPSKDPILGAPQRKNPWRAHILALGTFLTSAINYWIEGTKWTEDWDYDLTFSDQMNKLFSLKAHRFDSNSFATNFQHAFAGAVFYNIYRCNGYDVLPALKYSVLTSFLWEYIAEPREVVSTNDMIFNTFGALSIGENLFQFSSYFYNQKSIFYKGLGFILNPIYPINRMLDHPKFNKISDVDSADMHSAILWLGYGHGDLLPKPAKVNLTLAKLELELIPGSSQNFRQRDFKWSNALLSCRLDFSLVMNAVGIQEYRFKMRNIMMGWQKKSVDSPTDSTHILIGLGNGFDLYRKRSVYAFDSNDFKPVWTPVRVIDSPSSYTDKFSNINLIGPLFYLAQTRGLASWRLDAGLLFNFSQVNSLPLNALSQKQVITDTKTTLLYYGYYYAFGYSLFTRVALGLGPLEIYGDWEYQRHRSVDGLDRFQDRVRWDPQLSDSRTFLEAGLTLRPKHWPYLSVVYEQLGRWGRIEQFSCTETEKRLYLRTGISF